MGNRFTMPTKRLIAASRYKSSVTSCLAAWAPIWTAPTMDRIVPPPEPCPEAPRGPEAWLLPGDGHLMGEIAQPVQGEDLGEPAEGLTEHGTELRAGAADGGQGVDRHVPHVGELDADDPLRRPGGVRGLDALAADHLDDVAAVYRRDPKGEVVAVAVDDEGKYVDRGVGSRE